MDFESWWNYLACEGNIPRIVQYNKAGFPDKAFFNSLKRAMKLAYNQGKKSERFKERIKIISKI